MQLLTREQVREVDRLAIEEMGIPGIVLMENAGRSTFEVVLELLEGEMHLVAQDARVAVFCGGGNNGGDGYVIARHLANAGANVKAFAIKPGSELTGDAATNHAIAQKMGLVHSYESPGELAEAMRAQGEPHAVVDALLGTGFAGEVRDELAHVIDVINEAKQAGAICVAVDVPSGLDCDSGEPSNATVKADVTVTFVAPKTGFAEPPAEAYVGRIVPVDIGAPPWLMERVLMG